MGDAGRRRISEHFNWEIKGLGMAQVYAAVTAVRNPNDGVEAVTLIERLDQQRHVGKA